MWIKEDKTYVRGPIEFEQDGQMFTNYNPTPDFLESLGWEKVEDPQHDESPESEEEQEILTLNQNRVKIAEEAENYYMTQVLKIEINSTLDWIDLRTRAAYCMILDDLEKEGWSSPVEYQDIFMTIEEARTRLRAMNVYEAQCRFILNEHLRTIYSAPSVEFLEDYDYTENYPPRLVLES